MKNSTNAVVNSNHTGTQSSASTTTPVNPWLNISLADTVADCDKNVIKGMSPSIKAALELGTLPEPFHGDPNASVYLLCCNPGNSDEDKNFINCGNPKGGYRNIYEKEVCEELKHVNREFLWLRVRRR